MLRWLMSECGALETGRSRAAAPSRYRDSLSPLEVQSDIKRHDGSRPACSFHTNHRFEGHGKNLILIYYAKTFWHCLKTFLILPLMDCVHFKCSNLVCLMLFDFLCIIYVSFRKPIVYLPALVFSHLCLVTLFVQFVFESCLSLSDPTDIHLVHSKAFFFSSSYLKRFPPVILLPSECRLMDFLVCFYCPQLSLDRDVLVLRA